MNLDSAVEHAIVLGELALYASPVLLVAVTSLAYRRRQKRIRESMRPQALVAVG